MGDRPESGREPLGGGLGAFARIVVGCAAAVVVVLVLVWTLSGSLEAPVAVVGYATVHDYDIHRLLTAYRATVWVAPLVIVGVVVAAARWGPTAEPAEPVEPDAGQDAATDAEAEEAGDDEESDQAPDLRPSWSADTWVLPVLSWALLSVGVASVPSARHGWGWSDSSLGCCCWCSSGRSPSAPWSRGVDAGRVPRCSGGPVVAWRSSPRRWRCT